MKIQFVSDIHLEIRPNSFRRFLRPVGDILVLAGNIGRPFQRIFEQFLHWCSLKFPIVVFVPGNHEYYGSSISKVNSKLQIVCKKYGVYYLEKDLLEIPELNLVILGTTLWSDIPHENSFDVLRSVEDYRSIYGWSPRIVEEHYMASKNWLTQQIDFYKFHNPEYDIIVVTHHAPEISHTISPDFLEEPESCSYASNCTDLMKGVKLWFYGHTQYNNDFTIGKTQVLSNQRGCREYPIGGQQYKKDTFIELKKNEKNGIVEII